MSEFHGAVIATLASIGTFILCYFAKRNIIIRVIGTASLILYIVAYGLLLVICVLTEARSGWIIYMLIFGLFSLALSISAIGRR